MVHRQSLTTVPRLTRVIRVFEGLSSHAVRYAFVYPACSERSAQKPGSFRRAEEEATASLYGGR